MAPYKCVLCSKRTKLSGRRPLTGVKNESLRHFLESRFFVLISEDSVICNRCRQKYYNDIRDKSDRNIPSEEELHTDPTYEPPPKQQKQNESFSEIINIDIPKAGSSHSLCFLCRKPGHRLITVKTKARYQLFLESGTLLSKSARCCPRHVTTENLFDADALKIVQNDGIKKTNTSSFSKQEMVELIEHIRHVANKRASERLQFDANFTNDDYVTLTGLNKRDFEDLLTYVTNVNISKSRDSRTCLGVFLTKMRSGLSNRTLSTLFNMKKAQIRRAVKKISETLSTKFVPDNIGFSHISRSDVINKKTRELAKVLFSVNECNPPAILVLDGTYLYIQKSNNFKFQRRTYSMQKNRPLVKPMMVVTTSGYIVSVLGPYLADGKNSDANILKSMINKNIQEIKDWVQDGDVFVVDRGFRDSIELLSDIGVRAEMPCFLSKNHKQLTTEQANTSRLVTKVRWVVESVNARLKQWRFFDKVLPNSHLPNISTYLQVVCAIFNKYKQPLSEGQKIDDIEIASKMKSLSKKKNSLQEKVLSDTFKKSKWETVDSSNLLDFPVLTEELLREITLGVYMIKLAKCYTDEHLVNGQYELKMSRHHPGVLYVKLQSRHTSQLKHKLWIEYSPSAVSAWYCTCKSGARVVGSCAHVTSVLWFLSQGLTERKHSSDWSKSIIDAAEQ